MHVAHAGRYAKYWIDPVSLASVRGFKAHQLTEIHQIVVDNASMFLERWNEYFGVQ